MKNNILINNKYVQYLTYLNNNNYYEQKYYYVQKKEVNNKHINILQIISIINLFSTVCK